MRGREAFKTRFQRGIEIGGFDQIKRKLWHITPQNKLYYFSGKNIRALGAL